MQAMSDHTYRCITDLMYSSIGLSFNESKKPLVTSRLASRVERLGLDGFEDYFALISGTQDGGEFQMAVDLLTTNETYFFREPAHYELLESELTATKPRSLAVWSAASSFGDEAYSTAMLLAELEQKGRIGSDWQILGTDISDRVLRSAGEAVYPADRLRNVSPERLRRYCLRGEGESEGLVQIQPALRQHVRFGQLNLCEALRRGLSAQRADLLRRADQARGGRPRAHAAPAQRPVLHRHGRGPSALRHTAEVTGAGRVPEGGRMSPAAYTPRTLAVDRAAHVLHPGDVFCVDRGERLETLLGSCVAVMITDPRRTLGAMCHIVHCGANPSAASRAGASGAGALCEMYALLRARGIEPTLCDAWVTGGGNMFPGQYGHSHVGDDNAQWVLAALAEDGVRVLWQDVGGNTYRRVGWTVGDDDPDVVAVTVELAV
jgi:chemotaxis protein methyltransferase CheR